MGQEGKRTWDMGYFTKVIFRPVQRLKLIGSWFLKWSANFH